LDFERLWAGRQNTTGVERAVLARLLDGVDPRRFLEVGTGTGRLTPVLRARATEYVGLDLHEEFLTRIPIGTGPVHSMHVVGDAHRAPFVDGAFTAIVLVRVYNFLPDPRRFLDEMRRLLAPGGRLVIGYQPRPAIATAIDDVRLFLHGGKPANASTMSLTRAARVQIPGAPFPTWLPTRSSVRGALEGSGFRLEASLSTGLEDYSIGRRIPARWFVQIAELGDRTGSFPTQFIQARRGTSDDSLPWPAWERILACPNCRTPSVRTNTEEDRNRRCSSCGLELAISISPIAAVLPELGDPRP
ncbi:MAG: class I SAM-dependent methyltransferase, partial [Thermoplasmata archaeon]|nr:class I SAM-dependent methyltransferase [Thermoplasmata archaeon]